MPPAGVASWLCRPVRHAVLSRPWSMLIALPIIPLSNS